MRNELINYLKMIGDILSGVLIIVAINYWVIYSRFYIIYLVFIIFGLIFLILFNFEKVRGIFSRKSSDDRLMSKINSMKK